MTTIEYGYAAARLRAMKGRLLDRAFLERLIGMNNLTEMIVGLEQTGYKKEIHEAVLHDPGIEGVENGLRNNTVGTFASIREVVDGRVCSLVDILLGRWDTQNIKTVIRGVHVVANREQIMASIVPAGALSEAVLSELAGQDSVRACINLMVSWSMPQAKALTDIYFRYANESRLQLLEFALDKFYFQEALSKLAGRSLDSGIVREVIMREIDMINIMTLLRLTKEQAPMDRKLELFVEGGKQVGDELFAGLARTQDIDDIIEGLMATTFAKALKHGWQGFLGSGRFSLLERALEAHLIASNIGLFRAEPLSVAVIIAYIWAKLNEVINLRIILRGKAVGMPEAKVREALVFV